MISLPLLLLKLFLVPTFLLLLTLAGQRWGPSVGGWLAGFPVVIGPILFFLAIEQGVPFAAHAAAASLSAVFAFVAFSCAYAHAAQRLSWLPSLLMAWLAWGAAAVALSTLPATLPLAFGLALVSLMAAPRFFPPRLEPLEPRLPLPLPPRAVSRSELATRMLAGAALTVAVTFLATMVGSAWSGLLAGFPVIGSVLAVLAHRGDGFSTTNLLLRGMVAGLFSVVVFCFLLTLALPHLPMSLAFTVALIAAGFAQLVSKRLLTKG